MKELKLMPLLNGRWKRHSTLLKEELNHEASHAIDESFPVPLIIPSQPYLADWHWSPVHRLHPSQSHCYKQMRTCLIIQ